jgi:hypothetical protein
MWSRANRLKKTKHDVISHYFIKLQSTKRYRNQERRYVLIHIRYLCHCFQGQVMSLIPVRHGKCPSIHISASQSSTECVHLSFACSQAPQVIFRAFWLSVQWQCKVRISFWQLTFSCLIQVWSQDRSFLSAYCTPFPSSLFRHYALRQNVVGSIANDVNRLFSWPVSLNTAAWIRLGP